MNHGNAHVPIYRPIEINVRITQVNLWQECHQNLVASFGHFFLNIDYTSERPVPGRQPSLLHYLNKWTSQVQYNNRSLNDTCNGSLNDKITLTTLLTAHVENYGLVSVASVTHFRCAKIETKRVVSSGVPRERLLRMLIMVCKEWNPFYSKRQHFLKFQYTSVWGYCIADFYYVGGHNIIDWLLIKY